MDSLRMSSKDCRKLDRQCQDWHSLQQSASHSLRGKLLNLNHTIRRTFADFLASLNYFSGKGINGFGVRVFGTLQRNRVTHVAALADVWIEFNASQEGDAELVCGALATSL